MGGLIRNSSILLSVSYVQHCIVMTTGTVHIGSVNFYCRQVGKVRSVTRGAEIHTRQRGVVGQIGIKWRCKTLLYYKDESPRRAESPGSRWYSGLWGRSLSAEDQLHRGHAIEILGTVVDVEVEVERPKDGRRE